MCAEKKNDTSYTGYFYLLLQGEAELPNALLRLITACSLSPA